MVDDAIIVVVDRDLADLIPGFMDRRKDDLVKLRQAADAHDLETLRITGHSMKGTGGGYGFEGLSEIGALIEKSAKANDMESARKLLQALEDYLSRVQVRFE